VTVNALAGKITGPAEPLLQSEAPETVFLRNSRITENSILIITPERCGDSSFLFANVISYASGVVGIAVQTGSVCSEPYAFSFLVVQKAVADPSPPSSPPSGGADAGVRRRRLQQEPPSPKASPLGGLMGGLHKLSDTFFGSDEDENKWEKERDARL